MQYGLISKLRGLAFVWYYQSTTQWYPIGNLNTHGILKDSTPDLKNWIVGFDRFQQYLTFH